MNPEEFRLFYNQSIHPELMRLDRNRRRMLRMLIVSAVLMVGVGVLVYALSVFVVALMAILPFGIYISVVAARLKRFIDDFKPNVVRLILDFIDDGPLFGDLKYDAKRKIPMDKFLRSQLFITTPAVFEGEDFIEGRIGDVEFEMCELKVEEFSRVRQRLDSVFRGIFLRSKFHYQLKGSILILPRTKLPYLSETVKVFVRQGGQNMDGFIRNQKFRDTYITFGTLDTKVTELLTEELMSFILGYRKQRGEICLSMAGENCYVAIWNDKDILEPKIFQSNVSFELVSEFYNDIYVALYVVMALDKAH